MKENNPQNIVNMTDFKVTMDANNANAASITLLGECRELMTDRLSEALFVMLNRADDVLFDLVQKSGPSEHRFYFDAMRELRLKRTSIETGFKESFVNLFNKEINISPEAVDNETSGDDDREIDIEETIALTSTVGKIKHDCHNALISLDQRMTSLLSEISVNKRHNPIRPETVCHAFHIACQPIESGIEIKLVLFKLFEKYVIVELQNIYTDIDLLLTEKKFSIQSQQNAAGNYSQDKAGEKQQATARENSGIIKDKNYFIIANRLIRSEINKHIGDVVMPDFVKDFLYSHWSKLLLKIYIKEGVESKAWFHAIEVIDDLVNAIGSKTSPKEKIILAPAFNNLMQRLKYGMNVIPVAPLAREEFIIELRQYHRELIGNAMSEVDQESINKIESEDITTPSFRKSGGKVPFMDELFADNKGDKTDFDME
jgi:hypothetical protein